MNRSEERKLRRLISETARHAVAGGTSRRGRRSLVSLFLEDADPEKVDLPTKLSDVAKQAEKMKIRATSGKDDVDKGSGDDVVGSSNASIAAASLKPSQSTMEGQKGVQFAFSALLKTKPMPQGPGGDVGAIISKDNHIMDGHHRWIATLMVDPTAEMTGPQVDFPASKLIPVLNLLTVGKFNRTAGNPGSGGFDQFTAENLKPHVLKIIQKGYWGESDPAKCKAAAAKFVGVGEDTDDEELATKMADKMAKNIKSSGKNWQALPPNAPDRVDMPVINADEVTSATDALKSGEVDVNPPYGDEKEGKKETQNSGRMRNGQVVLERWQKLAGLLK